MSFDTCIYALLTITAIVDLTTLTWYLATRIILGTDSGDAQ